MKEINIIQAQRSSSGKEVKIYKYVNTYRMPNMRISISYEE